MSNKNIVILSLISKLTSNKGRVELNKLISKIKISGLTKKNSDIFITCKPQSPNPEIVNLDSNDKLYDEIIKELGVIFFTNILQPQMIVNTKHYIPIYDNDFSYSGNLIKKSNLVHFFISKNKSNKKLQILIQKGKTGFLADKFISTNGKKFYDV